MIPGGLGVNRRRWPLFSVLSLHTGDMSFCWRIVVLVAMAVFASSCASTSQNGDDAVSGSATFGQCPQIESVEFELRLFEGEIEGAVSAERALVEHREFTDIPEDLEALDDSTLGGQTFRWSLVDAEGQRVGRVIAVQNEEGLWWLENGEWCSR